MRLYMYIKRYIYLMETLKKFVDNTDEWDLYNVFF